jgi:hypothetical protein
MQAKAGIFENVMWFKMFYFVSFCPSICFRQFSVQLHLVINLNSHKNS